jgi:hypothetical protein
LPKDFKPGVFVGRTLESVVFYAYVIFFAFDGEIGINLESDLTYKLADEQTRHVETIPISNSSVMRFVGKSVSAAGSSKDGTLTLTFEDGSSLGFRDSRENLESCSIFLGNRRIIV